MTSAWHEQLKTIRTIAHRGITNHGTKDAHFLLDELGVSHKEAEATDAGKDRIAVVATSPLVRALSEVFTVLDVFPGFAVDVLCRFKPRYMVIEETALWGPPWARYLDSCGGTYGELKSLLDFSGTMSAPLFVVSHDDPPLHIDYGPVQFFPNLRTDLDANKLEYMPRIVSVLQRLSLERPSVIQGD